MLHLQTITEKNVYLEGGARLYSKEIGHEQIVQLMRNVYLHGTFVTKSGQRSIKSSTEKGHVMSLQEKETWLRHFSPSTLRT